MVAFTFLKSSKYLLLVGVLAASSFATVKEKILYTFTGGADGAAPNGSLLADKTGNLYGAAPAAGIGTCGDGFGCGTIFELTPNSDGTWSQKVIYSFRGGNDGWNPSPGMLFDVEGRLYGATNEGGDRCSYPGGCGTIFRLTLQSDGTWSKSTLYRFLGGTDGQNPSGVVSDGKGNLFGATFFGGTNACSSGIGCGTVFELSLSTGGTWSESIIYRFAGGSDPYGANASLILDSNGNLYGTSESGGGSPNCSVGCGAVFEVSPNGGTWSETVLYAFTGGADGANPFAPVVLGKDGNLYSTAAGGGDLSCTPYNQPGGCGVVFELQPNGGQWSESVLYTFQGGSDGAIPISSVVFDPQGDMLGATNIGGNGGCYEAFGCGTVFALRNTGNQWYEEVLYAFTDGSDGAYPAGNLLLRNGSLFGATSNGGAAELGTIYQIGR